MRVLFAICLMALVVAMAGSGQPAAAQDEMVRVRDSAFENRQRPAVAFDHDGHNERAEIDECGVCHHVYSEEKVLLEDETSEDQECSSCHTVDQKNPRLELIRAFHQRCKGCHQEARKGPVICIECHRGVETKGS